MTYTVQPITLATVQKMEKAKSTEIKENINEMLLVCESLNKLCETLTRLEHIVKKQSIKTNYTKGGFQ